MSSIICGLRLSWRNIGDRFWLPWTNRSNAPDVRFALPKGITNGTLISYKGTLALAKENIPPEAKPDGVYGLPVVTNGASPGEYFLTIDAINEYPDNRHIAAGCFELATDTDNQGKITYGSAAPRPTIVYAQVDLTVLRNSHPVGATFDVASNSHQLPYTVQGGPFDGMLITSSHAVLMLIDKSGAAGHYGFQIFNNHSTIPGNTGLLQPGDLTYNPNPAGFMHNPWSVIGGTGTGTLGDLTDTDLVAKAPASGDVLTYDGTNWVPGGAPSTAVSPVNRYITGTAGQQTIDLGRGDWRQARINVTGEARTSTNFLGVAMKKSDNNWSANGPALQKVYISAIYGNRLYAYNDPAYARNGDWFQMTYATNDTDFRLDGAYFSLEVDLTRMYDNYLTMHHRILYYTSTSQVCKVEGHWTFNGSSSCQDLRYLVFNAPNSGTRFGFSGSMTVV